MTEPIRYGLRKDQLDELLVTLEQAANPVVAFSRDPQIMLDRACEMARAQAKVAKSKLQAMISEVEAFGSPITGERQWPS